MPRSFPRHGNAHPLSLSAAASSAVMHSVLVVLPLALLAPAVSAQQQEPTTVEEEIVVRATAKDVVRVSSVATKLPVDVDELPVSVTVLPAGLIEEQSAARLGDLLPNAAGVTVQPSQGIFDLFVVRGLDSLNSGLLLIDGAPEPEATYYPLYNVEQVEVLRGPAASLYGGSPLSGVVGVVRKRPQGEPIRLFRATAGSFGTLDASFDYSTGIGDGAAFRLNALARTTDGYRDDQEGETLAVNPAVSFDLGTDHTLEFNGEFVRNESAPDAGLPLVDGEVADVPRTTSYQSPLDESEQEALRLRVDYDGSVGEWRLSNKLYYNALDWQSGGTILSGTFPFPPTFAPTTFRNFITLDNEQAFFGNLFEVARGTDRHNFLGGLELRRQEDDYVIDVGFLPPIDPFDPVEFLTGDIPFDPRLRQAGETTADILAPYVIERFDLGSRVSGYLGLRYDTIDFEDDLTGTQRDDDELSPLAGLTVGLGSGWSVYGSYASGFAPASSRVIGERLPEESDQVEVGLRAASAGGRLFLHVAAYQLDRENIAIFDANGVTAQQGSQRSEGVEFELTARPADGWRVEFGYAYTDAELTEFNEVVRFGQGPTDFFVADRSGNRPAFAPEHSASAWVNRQLGRWSFGAGLRYRDEFAIAADNAFFADSATLLEGSVSYSWPSFRLFVNGYNLTDEEYVGQGFGNTSVIPGDPASVLVGIEWRP